MEKLFLVADIGGTNTRVGLANDAGLIEQATRRFKNAESQSFEAILATYLNELEPGKLAGACAGVAGPVHDGVAQMTNLNWRIDRDSISKATGAEVVDVINDLQAQGYALDELTQDTVEPVLPGNSNGKGPRLVVGLGTGFNIVPVHTHGADLVVPSCEAGHAALPLVPGCEEFTGWLTKEYGFASIELALAGQGIENLYRYHSREARAASDVMQSFEAGETSAVSAMTDYGALLGSVVGDYALSHLPFGGIYLTGGVSRAVVPHLGGLGFSEYMSRKGRFSDLAASIGVNLIVDDFAALKGCARNLRQLVRGKKNT